MVLRLLTDQLLKAPLYPLNYNIYVLLPLWIILKEWNCGDQKFAELASFYIILYVGLVTVPTHDLSRNEIKKGWFRFVLLQIKHMEKWNFIFYSRIYTNVCCYYIGTTERPFCALLNLLCSEIFKVFLGARRSAHKIQARCNINGIQKSVYLGWNIEQTILHLYNKNI